MTTYRLLNRTTGNYVYLHNILDRSQRCDVHTALTSTAIDEAARHMTERFPTVDFLRLHSNGDLGDDWEALRRRCVDTENERRSTRTYRVIITDPGDPARRDEVGTYVVCADPRHPASPSEGPFETNDRHAAEDAADAFRTFFGNDVRYEVVQRFGLSWEQLAEQTRRDYDLDHPTTCDAFMCAAPAAVGNLCSDHAWTPGHSSPRLRRVRSECEECGTRPRHHDDLSETFVCDHVARELLDAGKPVTTKGQLAPA